MNASSNRFGALGVALAVGLMACTAVSDPGEEFPVDPGSGSGGDGSSSGDGGSIGIGGFAAGGSSSSGPMPTELVCPEVEQELLILDFRSGWWSGGGGGVFHQVALQAVAQTCQGVSVEYHHFEVSMRIKCMYETSGGGCEELFESPPTTSDGIKALFGKPTWDDYTQIWILSGSELDATDVALTGELFDHFLGETKGSCIPVLIGAGDGFITHGNAVAAHLGLGSIFTTEFVQPGFFSVALDPAVTVGTRMYAGNELDDHLLFQDVDSIADGVSNSAQTTHGDTLVDASEYDVIAHDSSGRPAIAVGAIELPNDGDRPFVIDAGFQRYYGMAPGEGTHTFLQNVVKYLGSVGCKAEVPK